MVPLVQLCSSYLGMFFGNAGTPPVQESLQSDESSILIQSHLGMIWKMIQQGPGGVHFSKVVVEEEVQGSSLVVAEACLDVKGLTRVPYMAAAGDRRRGLHSALQAEVVAELLLGLADPWQVVVVGSGRVKEMEGEEQLPALVLLTSAIMNCVSAAILGRPRSQV